VRGLFLLLLAAGCGGLSTEGTQTDLWRANYNKWNAVGPASYDWVVQKTCVCPANAMAVRVEVRNRIITARIDLATGNPVPADLASHFPDVPGLFALIKYAIDQEWFAHDAGYDGVDGHPILANLNRDGGRFDDDLYYAVTSFAAVTP
jgi:hypothetical protein